MNAQGQKGHGLEQVITPADVVLLVEEDIPLFPLRQGSGQIYPGAEEPQNKGGVDTVRQIDIALQHHRLRQPAAEAKQGDQAVRRHGSHPRQPDILAKENPHLPPIGFHLLHIAVAVRRRGVDMLDTSFPLQRVHRSLPGRSAGPGEGDGACGQGVGRGHRLDLRHHRNRRLDGHRAQQAKEDHRPQGIGKDLRRPLQQQPGQQDHEDDDAGYSGHIQHTHKNGVQHALTPCSGRSVFSAARSPARTASFWW